MLPAPLFNAATPVRDTSVSPTLAIKLINLSNSASPFSFYAKEIIALAYFRDKRYDESSQKFEEIANDASSPSNIASRSKIFSNQISSYEGTK